MSIAETRFNAVARSRGLDVNWTDKNSDGARTDDEMSSSGKNIDTKALASKVDQIIGSLDEHSRDFFAKGLPRFTTSRSMLVVGNPVTTDELKRQIAAHGDSAKPLDVVTSIDSLSAPTETSLIGGLDLNGDKHPDFILLQSFETYVAPSEADKHETVAFLAAINGNETSDTTNAPTADMIKSAKLLSVASYPGSSHPINGLNVTKGAGTSPDSVTYEAFDADKQKFEPHSVDLSGGNSPSSKAIFDALFGINAYLGNSFGYMDILMLARYSKGGDAEQYQNDMKSAMYNRLSFAFGELERRLDDVGGVNRPFARVLVEEARKQLILDEKDKKAEAGLKSGCQKAYAAERAKFLWDGKKMTRAEYYNALKDISDPKKRKELVESYSKFTIAAMKSEGGLFGAIDKFNGIASRYGYADYADMSVKVYNLADVNSFNKMMDEENSVNGPRLKNFIAKLRELNNGKEVDEWDVPYLTNLLIQKEAGTKELPNIRVDAALEIVKQYYADIGMDLNKPPFAGNIFFDTKKRDDKYPNAALAWVEDGSKTWMTANFEPADQISLADLGSLLHETAHAINAIAGSKNAGGNQFMNALPAQSFSFAEGFAMAMEYRFSDKLFMDRYLSKLPQFKDEKLRAAVSRVMSDANLYEQTKIMVRARQEIELYHTKDANGNPRSIDDRIKALADITKKYLHVSTEIDKLDFWSMPHPSFNILHYSNYSLGRAATAKAAKDIIDAFQGRRPIEGSAAKIMDVFHQGAKLRTLDEIMAYVSK